jgi:ATP-binding cassette subfamily B protein
MIDTFRSLKPFVRPYAGVLIGGLTAVVLAKLPQMAQPKVLQLAIDHLQSGAAPGVMRTIQSWTGVLIGGSLAFVLYAAFYLLFAALSGAFMFIARWYVISTSRHIEFDMRNALFDRLTTLSMQYYQRVQSGDIISRTTNDMDAVRMVTGPALMYTVNSVFGFALAFGFMVSISWRLTLACVLPFPLLMLFANVIGEETHRRYLVIQDKLGGLSARIQENLNGIRVIKAYVQEDNEIRRFGALNEDFVQSNERLVRVSAIFFPTMGFLAGVGVVAVLLYGGRMVIQGDLSLGQLVQFGAYLGMLIWPSIAAGWVINLFQRGTASLKRISAVLTQEPEIADNAATLPYAAVSDGAIEIDKLTFSYNGTQPALTDISLRVPARSTLGIVGPTGCGKTTLGALLARLYDPPDGTISIDKCDVRKIPVQALRSGIAFVPQDSFLFSDTIRENIRFGALDATDEAIYEAAEVASLRQEVEELPHKWETLLGERGITLSGGQKQRTAIARAIIRPAPILILDDALSAVDTDTESRIVANLGRRAGTRTTIIIAHRLSAVKHADQIIYLEGGRIVEQGTHDELLKTQGRYADLFRRQLLERELETA